MRIIINEMPKLELDQILSAYIGKPNKCMCGCSGKYAYSKVNQKYATRDRGYEVTDDEVNDGKIRFVLEQMVESANSGIEVETSNGKFILTKIIGNTQYTIYTMW